jgi:hypothetical protein
MSMKIELEDGISPQDYDSRRWQKSRLDKEARDTLNKMEEGQSFIVKTLLNKNAIFYYGKNNGLRFSYRKIYEGKRKSKDAPHYFRIWLVEKTSNIPSAKPKSKTKPKLADDYVQKTYSVADSVLAIADLKADNKKIVDDIEHIKKVLKEELGADLKTYEDYGTSSRGSH